MAIIIREFPFASVLNPIVNPYHKTNNKKAFSQQRTTEENNPLMLIYFSVNSELICGEVVVLYICQIYLGYTQVFI